MYLSDVSSGGGTRFPQLNVTIEPRKGRALLFPNVMNSGTVLNVGI
jgi:prolyl 4-hydroxylase